MDENFTDEHIIPRSLSEAREIYIANGSCSECNASANRLHEGPALAHDLKTPRYILELKRRNRGRKKKPLEPHWATYDDHDDLDPDASKLGPKEHPPFIVFQTFPLPGHLTRVNRLNLTDSDVSFAVRATIPTDQQRPGFKTIERRNAEAFALTVAKIGYTYAVARHGLAAFNHNHIRRLLRGKRRDVFNFVGNDPALPLGSGDGLHRLQTASADGWLVAIVQLFARYGMPPYLVVVGRKR